MTWFNELQGAFLQLKSMLIDDQNEDMLDLSYAEFTLKCYVGYAERIDSTLLREDAPLAKAFCSIGIEQPRDQLLVLFDTFYLHLRTAGKHIN